MNVRESMASKISADPEENIYMFACDDQNTETRYRKIMVEAQRVCKIAETINIGIRNAMEEIIKYIAKLLKKKEQGNDLKNNRRDMEEF